MSHQHLLTCSRERSASLTRDAWQSAHLLRWQHCLLLVGFLLCFVLLHRTSAWAQTDDIANFDDGIQVAPAVDQPQPALSEHIGVAGSVATSKSSAVDLGRPPLPFKAPLVGPLIRQVSMDNIEHRTTAFVPQSLDHLTPITLPNDAKWIRVDLSEQTVVAYERHKPVRAFLISSGLPGTPTVTGRFHIRMKVSEQTMVGGVGSMYYNLPGVKWVQYFYQDYGFHGTYWHSNFGQPMSHGCINMTDADAKWLFDWAGPEWDGETVWYPSTPENPGTLVIVTS
jgi:lipoprotein-anchoring transpeptidase ErfK/SrfK